MDERIPAFLREALGRESGEDAQRIEAGYRARRPVTLRANTLRTDRAGVERELRARDIGFEEVAWYQDALVLPEATEEDVRTLDAYTEGRIYLQSLSSMIPPLMLGLQPGEAVLDMAAAPGGKTTQMAALSGGKAQITACERDGIRCDRLRYNLRQQGAGGVTVMQTDARLLSDFFRFDRILLDAPCTGSGTLSLGEGAPARRMTPEWVKKTARTQKALLDKAIRLLKKGGTMVYSTCSILQEENEEAVRYACSRGMRVREIPEDTCSAFPCLPTVVPGTLRICPDRLFEGFFVAVLEKQA